MMHTALEFAGCQSYTSSWSLVHRVLVLVYLTFSSVWLRSCQCTGAWLMCLSSSFLRLSCVSRFVVSPRTFRLFVSQRVG